jgi:LysM repeat protein
VVRAGETFSGIAQRYKLTQDALAKANPAAYPDRLLAGERLTIPGAKVKTVSVPAYTAVPPPPASVETRKTHTVQPGESLGAIAKRYGMSTASLAAANKLKDPNLVEVGRKLVVPAALAPASAPHPQAAPDRRLVMHNFQSAEEDATPLPGAGLAAAPPAPAALPKPVAMSAPELAPVAKSPPVPLSSPRGVVAYRLEKGDDIDVVANVFGTTPAKIRELNLLGPTDELKEGQEIVVPALGPVN